MQQKSLGADKLGGCQTSVSLIVENIALKPGNPINRWPEMFPLVNS